jgi:hypothetical protein
VLALVLLVQEQVLLVQEQLVQLLCRQQYHRLCHLLLVLVQPELVQAQALVLLV